MKLTQQTVDFNESEVLYHARFSWNMLLADIDVKDLRASLPLILAPDDDDLLQAQGMNLTAEPAIRAWHENQPINVEIREDETVFLPRKTKFRYPFRGFSLGHEVRRKRRESTDVFRKRAKRLSGSSLG